MIIQIATGIENGVTKFSPQKAKKIDLGIEGFEFAWHKINHNEADEYVISEISTGYGIATAFSLSEAKINAIARITNPDNKFKERVGKILMSR